MNQAQFDSVVKQTIDSIAALLRVKGGEYAGSADRLANFKRGAALTGTTPLQVAFIYASKHYDSLANFVRRMADGSQLEMSEPIEGRLDDLINYCILMKAIIKEEGEVKIPFNNAEVTRQTAQLAEAEQEAQRRRRYDNEHRQSELVDRRFVERVVMGDQG